MPANRAIYQLAAILALACIAVLVTAFGSPYATQVLQPSLPDAHNIDFYYAALNTPRSVLAFMGTDTLFIFSYLTVFIGLYEHTVHRSRVLATVALVSGLVAGLCDMLENSYLISYALQGLYRHPLSEPALPLIYVLASMKWLTAFFTIFLFGLMWQDDTRLNRILSFTMLTFPLLGALTIAVPELLPARPLPLVVALAILTWKWKNPARQVL